MRPRRNAILKAAAGALQPESFDLTRFQQRYDEEPVRAKRHDLLGAIAYAGQPWGPEWDRHEGVPLAPFLLTLKYAKLHSADAFQRAALILQRRVMATKPRKRAPDIVVAICQAAVFEWVHDACRCREGRGPERAAVLRRLARLEADERAEAAREMSAEERRVRREKFAERRAAMRPKIASLFEPGEGARGIRCVHCGNSGRKTFTTKQRWRLVGQRLREIVTARGEPWTGLDYRLFAVRWGRLSQKAVEDLRRVDKKIAEALDVQLHFRENRDTDSAPLQELTELPIESAEADRLGVGEVRPENS